MVDIDKNYCGKELSEATKQLLERLPAASFSTKATGSAQKTLRICGKNSEEQYGYIDDTVRQQSGDLIGYRFPEADGNACPENLKNEDKLAAHFQKHYGCPRNAWRIHSGSRHKWYIRFRDPDWAYKVLLRDAKIEPAAGAEPAPTARQFVEGHITEVKLQRKERDPTARRACLEYYGYECHVCGLNLKKRYDLPVEVIHVHHEEPLGKAKGAREVDPINEMKPVCPNCHCVIHSKDPPYSVDEVKRLLANHQT